MRQFFPVEELARDERFYKITMRDRMNDPRAGGSNKPAAEAEQNRRINRLTPERKDASDAARNRVTAS